MKNTILSYWEGPKSPLIEICQQSLRRWNPHNVRILGPQDVPAEILAATAGISLAYRSDVVRLWALLNFGGIWADADSICISEVTEIEQVAELDLFGVFNPHQKKGWGAQGMLATPIGGRRNSPVIQEMLELCLQSVQRIRSGDKVPYGWTSVGLASSAWKQHRRGRPMQRKQHWQLHPVPWYRAKKVFFRQGPPRKHEHSSHWNPNAKLYHLTNAVTKATQDISREDLLAGNTFLAFLIQKALSRGRAITGRCSEIQQRLPSGPTRGAEVGVFRGMNARQLLQQNKQLTLLLVDRWSAYPQGSYRDSGDFQASYSQRLWDDIYEKVVPSQIGFAKDRYVLIRDWSTVAAQGVPDQSLDFVFIDGDHSYEGVRADLIAWSRKVKRGGFIGGHDYNHPREGIRYGVRKAVDQLATQWGHAVETGRDFTWFIRVDERLVRQAGQA